MTQYKAIPQPGDQRNVSQGDILNNFNYLNSQSASPANGIILVDHKASGDNGLNPTDGFHQQVSYLNRTAPASLTNAINGQNSNGISYTINDANAQPQQHFYNGVNDFQITPCLPIRAYANFQGSAINGAQVLNSSFNCTVARTAVGAYTLTLTNPAPSANYIYFLSAESGVVQLYLVAAESHTSSQIVFNIVKTTNLGSVDPVTCSVILMGG
jgi:hypothetical protein